MAEILYKEEEIEEGKSITIRKGNKVLEIKVRVITSIKYRNLPL